MSYSKYFSNGQKVFLKRVFVEGDPPSLDTLTGYTTASRAIQLELTLPYGSDAADAYPFEPGMLFEVMTDHRGMGLRLRASFVERTSSKDIRLRLEGNLEFISRRIYRRVDVNAWIGCRRSNGNLRAMREAWHECLAKIEAGTNPKELTDFNKYPINLAGGGLRMPLPEPVQAVELLLLFLSIGDKQGIICALAEVIWVGTPDPDGTQSAGLRFLNIREKDQARIDKVVNALLERLEQAGKA
jgi:c-di-GMP-binding flagellar brake protein YcgR